jgi:hypothetical protein
MASLPYTDGSNGNGITNIDELIAYLYLCPTAYWNTRFLASYGSLIKKNYGKKYVRDFFEPCSEED